MEGACLGGPLVPPYALYIHNLDQRAVIHAAGRVGGPAHLLRSLDGGASWNSIDMTTHFAAITDVKFFDEMNGIVIGRPSA